MAYILTYDYFPDCPSCDGPLNNPELMYYKEFDSVLKALHYIVTEMNTKQTGKLHFDICPRFIYELEGDGSMTQVAKFDYTTGFHELTSFTCTLDGEDCVLKPISGRWIIDTPTDRLLYGGSDD